MCLGFAATSPTSHRGQNRSPPKRRIKQPNKLTPDHLADKPPDATKDTHHHADAPRAFRGVGDPRTKSGPNRFP